MHCCFLVEMSWAGRIGAEMLIAVLRRAGHEVSVVFDTAGSKPWESPSARDVSQSPLVEELARQQGQVFFFSVVTDYYRRASALAGALKARRPDAVVVFGGPHPTYALGGMHGNTAVDYACRGEGDIATLELLHMLEHGGETPRGVYRQVEGHFEGQGVGKITEDLDSLPFPDKSDLYERKPMARMVYSTATSRGCPNHCSYCNSSVIKRYYSDNGERFLRRRSVDNVLAELVEAKRRWNPGHVVFFDDSFLVNKAFLNEFAERYPREVGIPFSCMTNPTMRDEELLRRLKAAGMCFTEIGIQSLNPHIRNTIFNRPESNERIADYLAMLKRAGIYTQVDHIINPWDTAEDLREQLRIYNAMRPSWINVFYLLYYPGTLITELARRDGHLTAAQAEAIDNGDLRHNYFFGGSVPEATRKQVHGLAMLLTFLPLLPARLVDLVLRKRWEGFFGLLPHRAILAARAVNALLRKDDFWGRSNLKLFLSDLFEKR